MERRRNRRGRCHSRSNRGSVHALPPQTAPKSWSYLNGLASFLIMTSLIAIIYLMLDYHCNNCKNKCDANNISKSIDDIAKNLSVIKDSYYDLEMKISRFSQDLPKLEGQIDILEAIANTMEKSHIKWDPKNQSALPKVDYLNKHYNLSPKNVSSRKCCVPVSSQTGPENIKVKQD